MIIYPSCQALFHQSVFSHLLALQFQKCTIKSKLLFREDPTLLAEATMQNEMNKDGGDEAGNESEFDT